MLDGFFGRQDAAGVAAERQRAHTEGHDEAGPRRHRPCDRSRAWRWARSIPARRRGCGTGKTPAATTRISSTRRGRTFAICSRTSGSASRSCIRRRSRAGRRASTRSICRRRNGRRFSTAYPGLHLQNRQISLDGEQVPAIIPALHHACGQQLRHAEAERLGRLLLRAEDRDVAGSAARVPLAEEGRGSARACRAER